MSTGIHKIHKGVLIKGNLNGGTVLDVHGTQGQLFSVTDNLVGLLHGVNDISGIPIFSVYSDDVVKMGTYNAEAIVVSGSTAIVKNLTVTGNLVGISSGAFISDTAPETPSSGMLWFNPIYGTLLTYVDSSWVATARDGKDGADGNPNNGILTLSVSGLTGSTTFSANQGTNSTFIINATPSSLPSTVVSRDSNSGFGGNLILDPTLGSNLTYSGIIETITVGESVVFGDVLYLKLSDGKYWKAKADAYTTTPVSRLALASISANASGLSLVEGNIRYDSWSFAANKIYLSAATAGAITTTQPSTTGNQIQSLGIAKTATTMWFKPSLDVGEK